jgi:hypothetical protein
MVFPAFWKRTLGRQRFEGVRYPGPEETAAIRSIRISPLWGEMSTKSRNSAQHKDDFDIDVDFATFALVPGS